MLESPPYLDALNRLSGIRAAWVGRLAGVEVNAGREEVMPRLLPIHRGAVHEFCQGAATGWYRAEQVHGAEIAVVPGVGAHGEADDEAVAPGVDGLICREAGQVLAIHVADCGAIWLVDRKTHAIGLLHSGKKGTEANILGRAVERMRIEFGTMAEDLLGVLSPCIRPPYYEVDFAGEIARQAARLGIGEWIDSGGNTACNLEAYYSYRMEAGRTGRMMALLYREPRTAPC